MPYAHRYHTGKVGSTDIAKLARSAAQAIIDPFVKANTFTHINTELTKSGNIDEATNIAHTITDSSTKTDTFVDIDPALAKSDQTDEAPPVADLELISIVNAISAPDKRARILAQITVALVKAGKTAEATNIAELALKTANAITGSGLRTKILGELAIKFSIPPLNELQAKATVAMLMAAKNPWSQFDVLLRVAKSSALAILPLLLNETSYKKSSSKL